MNNIPIYRAKKNNSDKYVEGYYFPQEWIGDYPNEDAEEREEKIKHFISGFTTHDIWEDEENHFRFMGIDEIDPTTLSVHFPDMLDSQGNKIFASLSEDGKGGDILDISGRTETIFINESIIQTYTFKWEDLKDFKKIRLGIQE
jgi:hypothetical protein